MTDIGNDKADTSKEMQVIDGTVQYPELSVKAARVNSFVDWPEDVKQRPELLAECGFFHCGQYAQHLSYIIIA